jgi:hypothetical protein
MSATVSESMIQIDRDGHGIDNEDEIGPVSEWMTERGSGTSPNR